jgi:geranylgeranyl pyrophosphate synthase
MTTAQRAPDIFAPCAQFESFARDWLRKREFLAPSLEQAIEYSFFSGGKRLRPILVYWTHMAVAECITGTADAGSDGITADNGNNPWPTSAALAALAVELIHCFSLVHDDLPALDNDDIRRGKPTLHRHCGEPLAILAGDAMMSLAFEAIASMAIVPPKQGTRRVNSAAAAACVRQLSRATTDMITGQVYDTLGGLPQELSDHDRVELIHQNKTGALIRSACMMGVYSAEDDPHASVLNSIEKYTHALGLIFQITDDLIDVLQPAAHAGKATGKDAAMGKLTYPGIIGVEASQREVQRLVALAQRGLSELSEATNISNNRPPQPASPNTLASRALGRAALDAICVQMALRTK